MRLPSDDLFVLIKALTQTEKRYFRLFASGHKGDKNYLKLFDEIEKQDSYDEERIRQKFKGEKFIRQLTFTKNYLFQLISKSLRNYNSEKSIASILQSHLADIATFFDKGLYKHSEKIVIKAKILAHKYEKFLLLLQLCDWELKLIHIQEQQGKTAEDLKKIFREKSDARDKYENTEQYEALAMEYVFQEKSGLPRNLKHKEVYHKMLNNPLLKNEQMAKSFQALYTFFIVRTGIYFVLDNIPMAYQSMQRFVHLMDQQSYLKEENIARYLISVYNIGIIQLHLKKYDEIPATIKKLEAPEGVRKRLKYGTLYHAIDLELSLYIQSADFEKGWSRIKEIEKTLIEFSEDTPFLTESTLTIYGNIFYLYFLKKDYHSAKIYLNKTLLYYAKSGSDLRSDLYTTAKINSLILHFELGDIDFLEYAVRSTYRFLLKKEKLYQFESVLLKFMQKKLFKEITIRNQGVILKQLRNDLTTVFKDPLEKNILHLFDYMSWLNSKIENRPFTEVIKEKAKI